MSNFYEWTDRERERENEAIRKRERERGSPVSSSVKRPEVGVGNGKPDSLTPRNSWHDERQLQTLLSLPPSHLFFVLAIFRIVVELTFNMFT